MIVIEPSDDWRTIAEAFAGRIVDLQNEYNQLARRVSELEKAAHGGAVGFCGECEGAIYQDGTVFHNEACSRVNHG